MNYEEKSKEELIIEIKELQKNYNSLKESIDKHIIDQQMSTKMFLDIIDKNPMSIQILDMEGYTIKVNPAHTKLFGVVPPPDYSIFNDTQLLKLGFGELFEKIKKGEDTQLPSIYYNAHDIDPTFPDNLVYLTSKVFTLDDINRKPEKIVIIHDDNTNRKLAEDKLNESKKMLELVMNTIPQFIFWKDRNSVFLGCNENFAHVAGLKSASEIIGKTDYDLAWKKEEADFFVECDRRVINSGIGEYHIIEPQFQSDGKRAWLDTNKVPIFDESGLVIGILGTFEDITERKHSEYIIQEKTYEIEAQNEEYLQINEELLKINIELKEAKQKTEESELQFKNLFENAADAIFIAEIESGTIVDANQAAEKLLQLPHNKIIGLNQSNLHPTDEKKYSTETFRQQQKEASELNKISLVENTVVRADGTEVPVEILASIVVYKGKKCLMGTFRDVTERKKAEIDLIKAKEKAEESENILKLSEEKFSKVFYLNPSACALSEAISGKYIEVNDTFYKLFGYSPEEVIGHTAIELHIMSIETRNSLLATADKEGRIFNQMCQLYTKTGEKKHGILSAENIKLQNKKYRYTVVHDITAFKQAEQLINENHELLNLFIKYSPINAYIKEVTSDSSKVLFASDNFIEMIGLLGSEMIGKTMQEIFPIDFARKITDDDWNVVSKGELFKIDEDLNNKNYYTIKFPIILNEKKLLAGYTIDITERKKVEEELKTAKEKAEESDRLKTAFLQNMSHEIRTPMNAIMGFSSLLVRNYSNKSKLEQFSQIINQRCSDLLEIINDILDISKIESGQLPVNIENCDINELFAELNLFFNEYQIKIGKQHLKFSLQFLNDKYISIIQTDKVKLKQILINLIGNAFKFTDNGSIDCGCKLDNDQVVFYVSDTGIGIPHDKHEIIFERFSQLHHSSLLNIGGTGLGLSIAKGLTDLLGGNIWLESEPDKGTTFYFSVNYIKPALSNHVPIEIKDNKEFNFQNKTILIVEDDIYNAEYLKEILADKGFSILVTEYAKKAIQIVENQWVDLILMDIRLPDMNGYDATKLILKINPGIKVIAQTAYAAHGEKQKALEAGCIDYISKPTNQELLMSLISKYLTLKAK